MNRKSLLAMTVVLVAASLLTTSQIALAHTRPIRFDPAPGVVLTAPPSKVDSWFTSSMRRDPSWNFLRVTDAQGNRVDVGEPILSSDRRQMTVNLQPNLAAGRYVVNWAGWDDDDGHILGDCFTFYVGQAAADAAIMDRVRLDGGNMCQRIDVSAREGTPSAAQLTPSPGGTSPAAVPTTAAGSDTDDPDDENEDGDGIPAWALILGVVAGIVVGGVGGRLVRNRA